MKNVVVTAYVSFRNPANYNNLNGVLRNQLTRYGYRIRQLRLGDYSRSTSNNNSFFNSVYQDYGAFVTVFLSVPNNASVNSVKNNFIYVLRSYGTIVSSYGQLGNPVPTEQSESDSQITVDENSVEVVEDLNETLTESTPETSTSGILLLGLGVLTLYFVTRN